MLTTSILGGFKHVGGFLGGLLPKNTFAGLWSTVVHHTPIPLHTMGQQRCFWVVVFETHEAKKYSPAKVLLGTYDGVFEMHNAKKCCLGSGPAPQKMVAMVGSF